ncbi:MAG: hypothetical protein ACMVY4_14395 [Minwuia sp.]|uniref:hypothetical protein n=1 Tax=Minwuia sp. TaxID=2493630 RepID=UPI003A846449
MTVRSLLLVLACLAAWPLAHAAEPLPLLTQAGPWTYAARPIGYDGRLWFANANRWPDHNSADIWSVRPDGGDLRRERRLFSQDAGEPVVHGGLLYWPLEDPRVSLGWGQIAVTDGKRWSMLETRTGRQFHLHGLFADGDELLAAGSSWVAQVLRSPDGGVTWSTFYEDERRESRLSRTHQLVPLPSGLFGDRMSFSDGERRFTMLRHENWGATPLPDWPDDGWVRRAVPWRGGGLALTGSGPGQHLRVFGADAAVSDLPDRVIGIDIDADGDGTVCLLGKRQPRLHEIWRLSGDTWELAFEFVADEAVELRLIGGAPVVAGTLEGVGAVWGRPGVIPTARTGTLPRQIREQRPDRDAALEEIRRALDDPDSYRGHGLILRNLLDRWIVRGLPGTELEPLLDGPFPAGEVRLIGGRNNAGYPRFGRWVLTWAMRRSGTGRVPASWIGQAFDEEQNASEKYFSEPLAAILTAGANGQDDGETAAALRERLTRTTDPDWLRADAEEALRRLQE